MSALPRPRLFRAENTLGDLRFFNAFRPVTAPEVLQPWRVERDSGTPTKRGGPTCTWTSDGFGEFEHAEPRDYAALESLGFLTEAGVAEMRARGVRDTHDLLARLVSRAERSANSIETWLRTLGPSDDDVRRAVAEGLWRRLLTVFDGIDEGTSSD